jgi:nucleoside-diphosphate-sugar epimerase
MAKVIFGCGYLGLRVARLWIARGKQVHAVTRSGERARLLAAEGLIPIVADIAAGGNISLPPDIETVLWAVGYSKAPTSGRGDRRVEIPSSLDLKDESPTAPPNTLTTGQGIERKGSSLHDVYVGGLQTALHWLPSSVNHFIYISSTGVYGQVTGGEVDEDSPCQPTREGGRACLAAEQVLKDSPLADRSIILRLAGLYGPHRIPRSKDLLAGLPIDAPSAGWLNLIHVEDAARIVLLAEQNAEPPKLYVVSDGHPVVRGDYYRELARLLGAAPPRFVDPPADSPAAARAASDKRVNPRRMFAELSPVLHFPSYQEGLTAITKP